MNRRVSPGENRDPRQDEQKDRRKEIMAIFQSTENMEHISRQELEDKLDTVLDRVLRENIGLVITDEGKDDLVLCRPSGWIRSTRRTLDLWSTVRSATPCTPKTRRVRRPSDISAIAVGYWMKRRCRW